MKVRPATRDDLPEILEIYNDARAEDDGVVRLRTTDAGTSDRVVWYSRPELNWDLRFRKPLLYPFELREGMAG